jgi:DNA polymerase III subunit delta'
MFGKLIGNEGVKGNLQRLVANGRVPHGLLFAGLEGVGKKEFALELARGLICTSGGCGDCPICTRIGTFDLPKSAEKSDDFKKVFLSGHPDVGIVIPYKRNILVDSIRDLEREANFRPYESEKRVFMIDDADKMNDSAANALLKTLEEPPSTTYLVLISSRPDSLLQTIRSRCQTIRFAPVADAEIEGLLTKAGRTPEDARLAARVSGGSVGRALSMDLGEFRASRDAMLGVIRSALATGDIPAMLRTSEQLSDAKNKERFEENIGILQTLVHDVFAIRNGSDGTSIINSDISGVLSEFAQDLASERLSVWQLEFEDLLGSLKVNVNRKVATDALFVKMAA